MKIKVGLAVALLMVGSGAFAKPLDVEKFNDRLKKNGADMHVINSVEVKDGMHFVFIGNSERQRFVNVVSDAEGDIAFVVVGIEPMTETGVAKNKEITEVFERIKGESLSGFIEKINPDAIFGFNGGIQSKNNTVVIIVDPNCPGCKHEIDKRVDSLIADGTPVAIIPVGLLGDDSASKAAKLISNKSKMTSFADFKKHFLAPDELKEDEKGRLIVEAATTVVGETSIIAGSGVPFRYTHYK